MNHPQVMQSPIVNNFLKVKIDGHTETLLVPKLLFQVSVRELHNNIVSNADNGGLKEARYEDDIIIIIDYILRSILPPQLICFRKDTRSCVVVNVEYLLKVYIHHYYHDDIIILKNLGYQQNYQNRRSGEKSNLHI